MLQVPDWDNTTRLLRARGVYTFWRWQRKSWRAPLWTFALFVATLLFVAFTLAQVQQGQFLFGAFLVSLVTLIVWFSSPILRKEIAPPDLRPLYEIERQRAQLKTRLSESTRETRRDIHLQIYKLFVQIANSASAVLSSETGANCAIAIKLLWVSEGRITVRNFVRDGYSHKLRLTSPEGFQVGANTAFDTVVHSPDAERYFAADDLTNLSANEKYHNKNERWSELYNSTAVCAIGGNETIVGFFCVDSWYGKLTARRVRSIIELFSFQVYTSFQLLFYHQQHLVKIATAESEGELGFRVGGALIPLNTPNQLLFQKGVEELLSSIASLSDDDLLIPPTARASFGSPQNASGFPLGRPLTRGAGMENRKEFLDEDIPASLIDQKRLEAAEEIANLPRDELLKSLEEIAPGNPYATGLLEKAKKNSDY